MNCGFYLFPGSETEFTGVDKKVIAQIKALSKACDTYKLVLKKEKSNIIKSIMWRLPFGSWGAQYEHVLQEIEEKSIEKTILFFYIRAQSLDRNYILFLRDLRERYPLAKILIEIPTYPYEYELLQDKEMWPWFFKDKLYRRFLKKYVDRIVTFSKYEFIYGVPTIQIINGIDITLK